jgi:hypothetical protein
MFRYLTQVDLKHCGDDKMWKITDLLTLNEPAGFRTQGI